ncbi:MAG: hypothetical protein K0U37_01300 [Gammaproteobacteria bacterium]|nr:hypothetical protein [Gammaproteobacteria bacterium]
MPYTKRVKDLEGGRAEVVSTELSLLTGISHPAVDSPEVMVTPERGKVSPECDVTLPQYRLNIPITPEDANYVSLRR